MARRSTVRSAHVAAALVCLAFARASSAGLEVTALGPQTGAGIERGVAVLRCAERGSPLWYVSRGALLDVGLGDADHDVLLTTAHGLPADPGAALRDCRVLGAQGRPYRLERVWRAAGDDHGGSRDWAVLLTRRRLDGDVA